MKEKDVIVSIDGKKIAKDQDLIDQVADSPLGTTLKVGIMRDKTPKTLDVVVADRVKTFADTDLVAGNSGGGGRGAPEGMAKLGVTIDTLTNSDKQSLGYTGTGSVVIASVEPDSFADGVGLAKGDILLEINRQAINSPADVKRIESTLKPGDSVAFHIARQGGSSIRGNGGGNWQPLYLGDRLPASGSN
jgi:serine protease Do